MCCCQMFVSAAVGCLLIHPMADQLSFDRFILLLIHIHVFGQHEYMHAYLHAHTHRQRM